VIAGVAGGAPGENGDASAPDDRGAVRNLMRTLARAVRASQLYLPNNPMHARALDGAREAFATVWRVHGDVPVTLSITETEFRHGDGVVLEERSRGGDSIPWLFYKDGIRGISFHAGVEAGELDRFLETLRRARIRTEEQEDLVTAFWECDFQHISYEYVEAAADGAAPGDALLHSRVGGGAIPGPAAVEAEEPASGGSRAAAPSPFARVDEQDATLYFLDEVEASRLRDDIRHEFAGDPRRTVIAGLLDTIELQSDPAIRAEVSDLLEQLLAQLLAARAYGVAAYLLQEAAASATRMHDAAADERGRLSGLDAALDRPDVLAPLLDGLEDEMAGSGDDVDGLLGRLGASALAIVLRQVATTRSGAVHTLLERVASRIAAAHTAELAGLVESEEAEVAMEAARRAAALRNPALVAPLGRVLGHTDPAVRREAVAALAAIGSAAALQNLERAVDDDDRAARVAAVEALAARNHRAAAGRVERALRGRVVSAGTVQERAVFLEAFARLGGAGAVTYLEGVLLPRGLLTRREDSATRAAVATALGKSPEPRAVDVLRRAAADRDVVVRAAAVRALRHAEGAHP